MLGLDRRERLTNKFARLLGRAQIRLAAAELSGPHIPAAHRPSPRDARKLMRAAQRNVASLPSATSPQEQLLLIRELLRVEPGVPGVVVEAGCWKGSSTAGLSLGARVAGRALHVFDTFAGLPPVDEVDRRHVLLDRPEIHTYEEGMFAGRLPEVQANVRRFGAFEVCDWHEGRVEDTIPRFDEPVVLAFVDLDLRTGVEACVRGLWPRLAPGCALFVHEAPHHEIASLFYDDDWWRKHVGEPAPGLAGAGSGLGLEFMDGFWRSSIGFARKASADDSYYVRPPVDIVGAG